MIKTLKQRRVITFLSFSLVSLSPLYAQTLNADKEIHYCEQQASKTLLQLPPLSNDLPRSIDGGKTTWRCTDYADWCSGFWPGILWNLYASTGKSAWKMAAEKYTAQLKPLVNHSGFDHDLGFMIFNSFGRGYQLTKRTTYHQLLLAAADSLATLYNPKIGTILSWPKMVQKMGWPHNTIIDNMMNLELLFWASKHGGDKKLYDIAVKHAQTTLHNHFRSDYSAYHVVVYDTISGKRIKGVTHQGYDDNSMWARGQAWAIYGFTMCYRESKDPAFLTFAQKVADVYLDRLPEDLIPFWDFNDPAIPHAAKDASAACITASALLELYGYVKDRRKARQYKSKAIKMLSQLSTSKYQSGDTNPAFLLHSTGNHPAGTEIDASIIYADYYYLEALMRVKKLQAGVKKI
ncbi:glucuronyl hydrolase [Mucilaginibacter sp. PPCGB 2223]|uniref:glycoside hydrolase family 88 protein n=1 Tax=Mucilaginibacter sp. PPCGB 2223 TaxID=1886027 RepID=UPI0008262F19|nr:glycoside hydrolase family 88 protein [Mucilaginibacter sp. PPCGB 2223]OCX52245.1 glucuronyl hydrolase [Mucilaginibacter sp. PPCGB 2223]